MNTIGVNYFMDKTIIYSDTNRVWCMGEHMDHPKVYYTIPDGGEAICGYCDIIFRLNRDKNVTDSEKNEKNA